MSYRPYIATSAFNKPIPSPAPIHPQSGHFISAANSWLLGGTASDAYKEWLGPRKRVNYWRGDTTTLHKAAVYCNWTPSTGFRCASTPTMYVPLPADFATLLSPGGSSEGDHVVAVVDASTGDVWELYHLNPPGMASRDISCASNRWNCSGINHFKADAIVGTGYTEPSGSTHIGFASESYCHINAGVLVPEDFADMSNTNPIPHALSFIPSDHCTSDGSSLSYPRHVPPARAGKGFNASGMAYGQRLQLDPALNIDAWPSVNAKSEPWRTGLKKILKAMQVYGLIVVDGTGGVGAGGFNACNPVAIADGSYNGKTGWRYSWDEAGYGWGYKNGVPYDLMGRFRVIDNAKWTGT